MKERKIIQILVDGSGHNWFCSKDGKIERFTKSGEMAEVEWFRQKNREFNGKYVIEIIYENKKLLKGK